MSNTLCPTNTVTCELKRPRFEMAEFLRAETEVADFLAATLRNIRVGRPASWPSRDHSDWETVWTEIEYHGVALMLHNAVERLNNWPQPMIERIAEDARLITLWEATHHQSVSKVMESFAEEGIECLAMKGTALAYAFHEEPAFRRRGDSDLLVQASQLADARETLARNGWRRRSDSHGLYYQETWQSNAAGYFEHAIDLHWKPADRPTLNQALPSERFFATKQKLDGFANQAFRPSIPNMILQATLNQKWHALHGYHAEGGNLRRPRRLIWSVDFELMTSAMTPPDWSALIEYSDRHGIGPIVAEALKGAQADLEFELPENDLRTLETMAINPRVESYFSDPDNFKQFFLDVKTMPYVRDKIGLIINRAFPPRTHLVAKYPSADSWPTAVLQGRMLVETAGRALRRLRPQ